MEIIFTTSTYYWGMWLSWWWRWRHYLFGREI